MANLPEAPIWEPGIYQFERTDVVEGGPDGIDNVVSKALANRTAYLKQEVELRAPLDSPALTGNPTAPTQAPGNNSTRLANTAFVQAALAALVDSSPAALDTLNELAAALGNDPNFATTVMNALSEKAPLNSPGLTGTPTAPTKAAGDNSTALASTAYVLAEIINEFTRAGQQSFGATGYQRLPGGLMMQWGRSTAGTTSGTISFPVAFPNAVLSVVTTDIADDPASNYYIGVDLVGTTAAQFAFNGLRIDTGVAGDPGVFNWIAVGH